MFLVEDLVADIFAFRAESLEQQNHRHHELVAKLEVLEVLEQKEKEKSPLASERLEIASQQNLLKIVVVQMTTPLDSLELETIDFFSIHLMDFLKLKLLVLVVLLMMMMILLLLLDLLPFAIPTKNTKIQQKL